MGRLKNQPRARTVERALKKAPVPARDWAGAVNARFPDPERRAAVLLELASLDEIEGALRPHMLRGLQGCARTMLECKKARARLLGFHDVEEMTDTEHVDVLDFVSDDEELAKSVDDDELNTVLMLEDPARGH